MRGLRVEVEKELETEQDSFDLVSCIAEWESDTHPIARCRFRREVAVLMINDNREALKDGKGEAEQASWNIFNRDW